MQNDGCTLLIRHLPKSASPNDTHNLLFQLGACRVRLMNQTGRLRYCGFATFPSVTAARRVLQLLHQLPVAGRRLCVEFARQSIPLHVQSDTLAYQYFNGEQSNGADKQLFDSTSLHLQADSMSSYQRCSDSARSTVNSREFTTCSDEAHFIQYLPPPNLDILQNVCAALVTHSRFYQKVLMLMKEMGLPAPFCAALNISDSSPEESELEDDGTAPTSTFGSLASKTKRRTGLSRVAIKRFRAIANKDLPACTKEGGKIDYLDAFEPLKSAAHMRKNAIQLLLPDRLESNVGGGGPLENTTSIVENKEMPSALSADNPPSTTQQGGFGVIAFSSSQMETCDVECSDEETEMKIPSDCYDIETIAAGRISHDAMKEHPVFQNYNAGVPSCRLYVKNLSRTVQRDDLLKIFGAFVNRHSSHDLVAFDIQLMTRGRMKGQAFVTLPSEDAAQLTRENVNGYVLHGKPMVVQFARSMKANLDTRSLLI